MGAKCCTDRKREAHTGRPSQVGASPYLAGAKERKPSQGYDNKKWAVSVGYSSKGDDAEKFEKAAETNNLELFVELLPSTQKIESFAERMHPWAEDPKTVGALAGTQLAILASGGERGEDPSSVKHRLREAGALEPLVGFLRSDEVDRVQTAVVALSFLTAECPANTIRIYEAGAMELLMKHVESPLAGMRTAAATTLRNICMERDEYKRHFVELGGIKGLVAQLDPNVDSSVNTADVQLEAVLNLQDIIEDEDDGNSEPRVVEKYAFEAIEAGAMDKLAELIKVDDDEVSNSAKELLVALQNAKR